MNPVTPKEMRRRTAEEAWRKEFQQVRSAAVIAASTFCAPNEASDVADVLRIAEQFADYISTGGPHRARWDEMLDITVDVATS